jgi:hypothetical protein
MADRLNAGRCTGGPLDGTEVSLRTPGGFLAVDRAAGKAWMYRSTGTGFKICTDHDDSLVYPGGLKTGERSFDESRAWQAGEESELDIIAVDS